MDSKPRKTCGGILIADHKILLGKRKSDRLYPDIWDIFGGHIEEGEAFEETLFRELEEEIGIRVKEFEYLESYQDKDPTFGLDYIHHIYIVRSWDGTPENKNQLEHDNIRWFSKSELKNLPMHGEVKRIIRDKIDF